MRRQRSSPPHNNSTKKVVMNIIQKVLKTVILRFIIYYSVLYHDRYCMVGSWVQIILCMSIIVITTAAFYTTTIINYHLQSKFCPGFWFIRVFSIMMSNGSRFFGSSMQEHYSIPCNHILSSPTVLPRSLVRKGSQFCEIPTQSNRRL